MHGLNFEGLDWEPIELGRGGAQLRDAGEVFEGKGAQLQVDAADLPRELQALQARDDRDRHGEGRGNHRHQREQGADDTAHGMASWVEYEAVQGKQFK